MKFFFSFFIVISSLASFSQNCSCQDEFLFIKDHIEKNHGGFNKKIKSATEPAYKTFTDQLMATIKKDKTGKYCIAYLKKYILYLQDHHSNITGGNGSVVKEDSADAIEAFLKSPAYLNTEKIIIENKTAIEQWKAKEPNGVEGIYYTPDSTYTVAMIKNKTDQRDYAGIILSSKTKLWSPGQVKIELKQVSDSLFDAYIFFRNHSLNFEQVSYKKGQLQLNGWNKAGADVKTKSAPIDNDVVKFTVLDSSTALLSIRSFHAGLIGKLDSAYKKIIPEIKKYPNLIIDVRNNSGGSDNAFSALIPFIYTGPYEGDVMEYFSTPDNIKAYQDYDNNLVKTNAANKPVFTAAIVTMKKGEPYSFVPFGNGKPVKVTSNRHEGYPDKVVILYNRNCASSCESLLFAAMKSSKTMLVGENSGGFTGYGNVMTLTTPCGNQLFWTTTVYKNQWEYEFVGIPPLYRIPETETDWVEYTRKLLEK